MFFVSNLETLCRCFFLIIWVTRNNSDLNRAFQLPKLCFEDSVVLCHPNTPRCQNYYYNEGTLSLYLMSSKASSTEKFLCLWGQIKSQQLLAKGHAHKRCTSVSSILHCRVAQL
jgi:hypothetical protein